MICRPSSINTHWSQVRQQYGRFADVVMETVRLCGQLHHRVQQHEGNVIHLYGRCRRWRLYGVSNGDRVGDTWRPLLPDGRSCQWTSTEPTEWHAMQLYRWVEWFHWCTLLLFLGSVTMTVECSYKLEMCGNGFQHSLSLPSLFPSISLIPISTGFPCGPFPYNQRYSCKK